jgi:hypothetical protein
VAAVRIPQSSALRRAECGNLTAAWVCPEEMLSTTLECSLSLERLLRDEICRTESVRTKGGRPTGNLTRVFQ